MGVHKMLLLIMVLFSFCSPALSAQVNKNSAPAGACFKCRVYQAKSKDALNNSFGVVFYPDDTHENMANNGISENNCTDGNGCGMVNQNKYTNDITSGRGGGRPVGNGGANGNGGQTNSFPQGGGNGVVPVYAAGAAAQRRNHKGAAATDTLYRKGRLAVLMATATASFLLS